MANWITVASAEHVRLGVEGGFMQVCHGKAGPLGRIKPGDGVTCYSPSRTFGGADRLQAFTAIGTVGEGKPYLSDMGGFRPFRRDVAWARATLAPIRPLLDLLEFTARDPSWGFRLRFGVLTIGEHDFALIAHAMGATDLCGRRLLPASKPLRVRPTEAPKLASPDIQ
jgi:EVE domain